LDSFDSYQAVHETNMWLCMQVLFCDVDQISSTDFLSYPTTILC